MFWSEGSALFQVTTGDPDSAETASARAYLQELRENLLASADMIGQVLA
jgi:hypothetical protein